MLLMNRSRLTASLFVFTLMTLPLCVARAADSSGVVGAIEKKYAVTDVTSDHEQITKDGTTMVMKTAGVYSAPSTTMMIMPDNTVIDGKIKPPSGFMKLVLAKSGSHVLQTNDKVYITKIDSKNELTGDVLKFTVLTVDSLDVSGSDAKKKYDATISFKFKKGYLQEASPDDVEQTIETILAPDSGGDDNKSADTDKAAAPASAAPRAATPVAAAPAAPAPAPTPAAPPPTISIGESSTQVLQAMGMPLQMIDLGKKKTFVYKNMKVIFLDDKVSDVQ